MLHDDIRSMLWQYGMSAMISFPFHLIGRIDDSMQVLLIENLCIHIFFANWLLEDKAELVKECWRGVQHSMAGCVGVQGHSLLLCPGKYDCMDGNKYV